MDMKKRSQKMAKKKIHRTEDGCHNLSWAGKNEKRKKEGRLAMNPTSFDSFLMDFFYSTRWLWNHLHSALHGLN